jgi:hypothetical protein
MGSPSLPFGINQNNLCKGAFPTSCQSENLRNKPVCGYLYPTLSATNFKSQCEACSTSSLAYFVNGVCPPSKAPAFKVCTRHTIHMTRCEVLSPTEQYPHCIVHRGNKTFTFETVNYVSRCTDLCRKSSAVMYINAACNATHEGRRITDWARTFNFNSYKPTPYRPLQTNYTKCPAARSSACGKTVQQQRVCALSRDPQVQATVSGPCRACADQDNVGYALGACKELLAPPFITCLVQGQIDDPDRLNMDPSSNPCSQGDDVCVISKQGNEIRRDSCQTDPCKNKSISLYVKMGCNDQYEQNN